MIGSSFGRYKQRCFVSDFTLHRVRRPTYCVMIMDRKTEIADLIPKGLGAYWFVFLAGATTIGLLEFGYFKMASLAEKLGVETIAPLDVTFQGSLLSWGIAMLLLLTAGVSLINYGLCRKYGDRPVKAQTWFWTAAALLLLSMDTVVALRETFSDILVAASGTTLYMDGAAWWLALYIFFFGVFGTRLLLEIKSYAPALGFFLLAIASVAFGLLIRLEMLPIPWDETETVMLRTALHAIATLLLLLSFTLFARRQVFRDADVALRWFAKVWNQTPILASVPVPAPPAISETKAPAVEAEKPSPPAPEKSETKSGILASGRPVVQKPSDVVPFKGKDSDEFDLSGIA